MPNLLKIQRTERSEGAVVIKSAALKKRFIRFRERSEQELLFQIVEEPYKCRVDY